MNAIKTLLTSLVVGAVTSAATTIIIARATAKAPEPPCASTGTRLAAPHCAVMTGLLASDAERRAELADARRRLALAEETARLSFEPRFFCAGAPEQPAEQRTGECFRSVSDCVGARTGDQICWYQTEAVCFQPPGGGTRCASSVESCVAFAITAGLGDQARAACRRTYVDPPSQRT